MHGFKHTGALAWVLGAEGEESLRRLTCENCDELVRIPMLGSVESLNVLVSAGICLFEARRQRKVAAKRRVHTGVLAGGNTLRFECCIFSITELLLFYCVQFPRNISGSDWCDGT